MSHLKKNNKYQTLKIINNNLKKIKKKNMKNSKNSFEYFLKKHK